MCSCTKSITIHEKGILLRTNSGSLESYKNKRAEEFYFSNGLIIMEGTAKIYR